MDIALATSLHLDHGWRATERYPASLLQMQDFVPVGLLCVKSALDARGLDVNARVIEVNALVNAGAIVGDERFHAGIAERMLEGGSDLVGLMTDPDSLHHTVCIAKHIKLLSPYTRVCLGGPTSSPIARMLLERVPSIDLVVRGEGEITFAELVEQLVRGHTPQGVAGVSWRDGARVVENPSRRLVENLDRLPMPAFEAFDMAAGAPLYLDVGRGCPFSCRFCATAPFWERNFRMKSVRRIIDEICVVRDRYGREHVNFSHDLFTANRNFVEHFCARLVEERVGITWTCSSRTDLIDAELLEKMAGAGCVEIYYGIESGSPDLQHAIDKHLDLDRAREVVVETRTAGIRPVTGFIVGYPMETEATFEATLRRFFEFLELGGFRAHLFALCPFPEAPMYAEHRHSLERLAELYDLPLPAAASDAADALRAGDQDLFCSTYRYATPHVRAALVDASEEIAPHLVTLKALWPRLLLHYTSPLDWYRRWTDWIEMINRERGRRPTLHQGTAADLLAFIAEELERLAVTSGELAALVGYERLKLTAQHLRPTLRPADAICDPEDDHIAGSDAAFLVQAFDRDMSSMLRGHQEVATPSPEPRWVVAIRRSDDTVETLQIGLCGHDLIEGASRSMRVGDLIESISRARGVSALAVRHLLRGFVARGLLNLRPVR
ncbi:MAG: B12-binding domain-containing radical SAM protein [Deltaproteobacteria bacterium]|nr:B12-binding domain-containing radical SAM protein [Deltaproteobacteria bacterium]